MPRIYTYTRSATNEPDTQSKHDAALQAWLARYPDHSLAGAFEDRGVSGLTPPDQRAGFKALLAALQAAPAEIVLVPALEHVSRDRGVPSMVCAQLRLGGVRLLTTENLPTEGVGEQIVAQGVLSAIEEYRRLRRSRKARV